MKSKRSIKISDNKVIYLIICLVFIITLFIIFKSNALNSYQGSNFRNFVEILYFISSLVVVIIAFLGLKQINTYKRGYSINARRDSYRIASEKCEAFLIEIIPKLEKLDSSFEKFKIEAPIGEIKIERNNKLIKTEVKLDKHFVDILLKNIELLDSLIKTINHLEAFSVFFVSRVADESIAFNTIGRTYCSSIKKILPLTIMLGANGNYFNNTLKLYFLWNDRLERKKIKSQIESLKKSHNEIYFSEIEALGCNENDF